MWMLLDGKLHFKVLHNAIEYHLEYRFGFESSDRQKFMNI